MPVMTTGVTSKPTETPYKPDDQVSFWGFLQQRSNGKPEKISVEIAEGPLAMPEAKFLSYFLPSIQKQ